MEIIIGMSFIVALGAIYVLSYYFNHKTPVPKGCENLTKACEGCSITTCDNNPNNEYKEKKDA